MVGAAQDRKPPGDGRGFQAGFQERSLVHFHMVGRHVRGVDSLGLHVPQEVHEVAAVGFDRIVDAASRRSTHQGPGGGGASLPVASRARATKASTCGGPSVRSGTSGVWGGAARRRWAGRREHWKPGCLASSGYWLKPGDIKRIMSHTRKGAARGQKDGRAGDYVEW